MKKIKQKPYNHNADTIFSALGFDDPESIMENGFMEFFMEIEKKELEKGVLRESERVEIAEKYARDPMRARAILFNYLNLIHALLLNDVEKLNMFKHTIMFLINMKKGKE